MTEYENVNIEIAIPVEQKQLYEELLTLVESNLQTLVDKNEAYGDIRSSAQLLSELDVYDSAGEAFAHRGFSRLTEKHSRYAQLHFGDGGKARDERLSDTCLDAMNYWLWQAWLHEYGHIREGPVNNSPWTQPRESVNVDEELAYGTGCACDGSFTENGPDDDNMVTYTGNPASDEDVREAVNEECPDEELQ